MKSLTIVSTFKFIYSFTILLGFNFFVFLSRAYSQDTGNQNIKLCEQQLYVYSDTKTKTWQGMLTATVEMPPAYAKEVQFCCKNFKINFVRIVSETGKKNIQFHYTDSILAVNFTNCNIPHNTISFEIGYTAFYFDKTPDCQQIEYPGILPQTWFRHKTVAASAFYPVLLSATFHAPFQISIQTKAGNKAISNGNLIANNQVSNNRITYNWHIPSTVTPNHFIFAVGAFKQFTNKLQEPIVHSFYSKPLCFVSDKVNKTVSELCDFYSGFYYLAYPYPAFTSVFIEENHTGIMGTSTCILPDSLLLLVNSGQEDVLESCIAYPVAYQYFNSNASYKSLNEKIFSETLAQYSVYLFLKKKYGSATADAFFYHHQLKNNTDAQIFNITGYNQVLARMTTHNNSLPLRYLHYFHQFIGDSLFSKVLQNYVKVNSIERNACYGNFVQIIDETTTKDCNWFISNLFHNNKKPIIRCKPLSIYGDTIIPMEFVCKNIPSGIRMPVLVDVFTQDSVERKTLWINNGRKELTIRSKHKIVLVRANPDEGFPGEINQYFTQKENQLVFRRSNSLKSRIIALRSLLKANSFIRRQILSEALNDSIWYIRYTAVMNYKQNQNETDHNFLLHLQRLAKHDENYRVRAIAIARLTKTRVTICLPLLKSILRNEKNPVVIGEILDALYTLAPLSALQVASKCFSDSILFSKALHVYCSYAGKKEFDSIVDKYNSCNFFQKKDFFTGFTDFLIRFDQTTIDKGQQFLVQVIAGSKSHSLKTEAMKALIAIRVFYTNKQLFWNKEYPLYAPKSIDAQKIKQRIAYYKKQETIINETIDSLITSETNEKLRNRYLFLK